MRLKNILLPAAFLFFTAISCTKAKFNRQLEELDITLSQREQIKDSLENRQDEQRKSWQIADSTASLQLLYELVQNYRFFDCNSAYKYSLQLFELADRTGSKEYLSAAEIEMSFHYHFSNKSEEAIKMFESIDTAGIVNQEIWINYFECGHTIYKNINGNKQKRLHEECMERIPDSQIGIRIRAKEMMDEGQYEETIEYLSRLLQSGTWTNREMAVLKLYISNCYDALGNNSGKLKWLVLSAEDDCLSGYRQYSSLKLIADELYSMGQYEKEAKYLRICIDDFHAGAFQNRSESGNESLMMMENTIIKVNKLYHFWLIATIIASTIAILAISYAYYKAIRRKNTLKKLYRSLKEVNRKLKHRERELTTANLIRDKYVFQFMLLSKNYINMIDSYAKKMKRMLMSEGAEAVAKELKRQDITDTSRKEFYATFDHTFLGLFPDFIDKFNNLLPEEERMYVKRDGSLCTEMRIFASIKLGITNSREIADFLDYALTTVYTYRTRIKNRALCDKDEFEKIICE